MIEALPEQITQGLMQKFWQKTASEKKAEPKNGAAFDIKKYLQDHKIQIVKERAHGDSTLYCLDHCVFDQSHKGAEAAIGQTFDGLLFYQCFHDSCKGKTWKDARKVISGDEQLYGSNGDDPEKKSDLDKIELVSYGELAEMEFDDTPLIDGLLDRKETLIVSGPSGIGKSAFANFLTLAAASPPRDGLWGKFQIPNPITTLVVQSENSMKAQSRRIQKLFRDVPEFRAGSCRVITTKVGNDCRLFGDLVDPDFKAKLVDMLAETQADILLLDPLISYHTADENDNVGMRRALDHLTSICDIANTASIIFHHFNRQGQTRGASSIRDWAANLLLMEYATENNRNIIKMVHDKCRNFEQQNPFFLDRTPNLSFLLCDQPGGGKRACVEEAICALEEIGGRVESQNRFVEIVTKRMECSRGTAQAMIKRAVTAGKIHMAKTESSTTYYLQIPETSQW